MKKLVRKFLQESREKSLKDARKKFLNPGGIPDATSGIIREKKKPEGISGESSKRIPGEIIERVLEWISKGNLRKNNDEIPGGIPAIILKEVRKNQQVPKR